jgi:DNA (cytosine-5)-methyltransferase 1
MRHLDLFSGIGGFALAAREVWGEEHEVVGFCDNDHFCQNVLSKNFPGVPIYGDIRELTAERLATDAKGQRQRQLAMERKQDKAAAIPARNNSKIDLLTGGFPCQPFSNAGKKRGDKDDRFLWPEMLRVIRETKPAWVIGENVAGIVKMALDKVCSDLEGEGYAVQPFVIPACAVGAPHRRDRVWIVGRRLATDPAGDGQHEPKDAEGRDAGVQRDAQGSVKLRQPERSHSVRPRTQAFDRSGWSRDWREVAAATCHDRMDDGIPEELVVLPDGTRISQARWRKEALKAYGNAIVPQVAIEIMKAVAASRLPTQEVEG